MTEEEYNRESEFVTNFINERQRTPTFSDAIEITMEQMIDKTAQWLQDNILAYNHESSQADDCYFDDESLVEDFKKAMEG